MSPSHQWYGVIPGWLFFYALIVIALALLVHRVTYLLRIMLKGKAAARWDHVPARLRAVLVFVLGQLRLLRGDFWPGLMHATIFWGFLILTLGTLEFFGKGFTERFFLPFLSDTPAYLVLQEVFSLWVIAAVAYAASRRLVTKPKRLTFSPEGLVILLLIFGLIVTDLAADATRIILAPAATDRRSFAGDALAGCPAPVSGKQLDPKMLILDLQEHLLESGPRLLGKGGNGRAEKAVVGEVITDNVLWACTTCRWCVDACPVFIEHVPKIVDMRRWLVLTESRFPAEMQPTFRNLENNGNPWQIAWQTRADWAKDLGVRVMSDVSQAEYLYWVGCYGCFDERNKKVARAFVKLLQAAGVDFAIL